MLTSICICKVVFFYGRSVFRFNNICSSRIQLVLVDLGLILDFDDIRQALLFACMDTFERMTSLTDVTQVWDRGKVVRCILKGYNTRNFMPVQLVAQDVMHDACICTRRVNARIRVYLGRQSDNTRLKEQTFGPSTCKQHAEQYSIKRTDLRPKQQHAERPRRRRPSRSRDGCGCNLLCSTLDT